MIVQTAGVSDRGTINDMIRIRIAAIDWPQAII